MSKYIRYKIKELPSGKKYKRWISENIRNYIIEDLKTMTVLDIAEKYHVAPTAVSIIRKDINKENLGDEKKYYPNGLSILLSNDEEVIKSFQKNLPFNQIYLVYCKKHNVKISYNTFYQTCKRLGFVVKLQYKK